MRYLRLSMLETDSICAKSCAEMEIGMDKENAIEVKNITKDFKVYYDKGSELKEKMLFWKRNRYEKRHGEPPQPLARNPKNTAMRSANRFIEDKIRKKSRRNVTICEKYTIFALRNATGCSSARLEYASGGRVVAGSNPVTPTDGKSLIFSRISRIFLL